MSLTLNLRVGRDAGLFIISNTKAASRMAELSLTNVRCTDQTISITKTRESRKDHDCMRSSV